MCYFFSWLRNFIYPDFTCCWCRRIFQSELNQWKLRQSLNRRSHFDEWLLLTVKDITGQIFHLKYMVVDFYYSASTTLRRSGPIYKDVFRVKTHNYRRVFTSRTRDIHRKRIVLETLPPTVELSKAHRFENTSM